MTDPCPTENCTGTLTTTTSKRLKTIASIERRRECKCCGRVEVAIVRPAVVVGLRVVHEGNSKKITSPKSNPNQTL